MIRLVVGKVIRADVRRDTALAGVQQIGVHKAVILTCQKSASHVAKIRLPVTAPVYATRGAWRASLSPNPGATPASPLSEAITFDMRPPDMSASSKCCCTRFECLLRSCRYLLA